MCRSWKSFEENVRKSLQCHEETVGGNTHMKDNSFEGSSRKEERWRVASPTACCWNMGAKGAPDEFSDVRDQQLETGGRPSSSKSGTELG